MKAREADKAYRSIVQQKQVGELFKKKQQALEKMPTVVETLTERILIKVPRGLPREELPALCSAIKHYIITADVKASAWTSMRKNYRRDLTLIVDILCDDIVATEVIIRVLELPVYLNAPHPFSSYAMYYEFNDKIIKTFRDNGKFHAATTYGLLLGCEAQALYTIPVQSIPTDHVDILVIDDSCFTYKQVWQWIGTEVPQLKVSRIVAYDMSPFSAMLSAISNAKLVVGNLSMWTYFACCMGKPVFEMYPTTLSKNWLSKWSNKFYSMYVCDKPDKEIVLRGVARLWVMSRPPQVCHPIDATTTVQLPSIAPSVETA